ncbi:MAG TPA: hypothetical protein VGG88_10060, partial [Gaiellaceae bacterium]
VGHDPAPAIRRGRMRRAAAVVVAAALLGAVGAAVAHAFTGARSTLGLPELHGQVSWKPGARRADVPRGRTAVLVFLAPGCSGCLAELRYAVDRLPPSERPLVVRRSVKRGSVALLVDRNGWVRTGYAFPFAPAFVEGDLRTLAR